MDQDSTKQGCGPSVVSSVSPSSSSSLSAPPPAAASALATTSAPTNAAAPAPAAPLGSASPGTDGGRNPFQDGRDTASSHPLGPPTNPFTSPEASRPASSYGSSTSGPEGTAPGAEMEDMGERYFHSRRVRKDELEKPWLHKADPKEKWVTIVPLVGILVGLGIAGFLVWDGLSSVVHHKYCPVLDDTFGGGALDTNVWTKEVQVGGFGNGEFEETTGGTENVFIQDGRLVIKATLQDANMVEKNTTINLLADGTCTSTQFSDCVAVTNTYPGNASIVPPTKSGRINTKKAAQIKYGRVEVTARLPQGDWLWPAIWMLPVNNTYGPWPRSGEIDIMESRGNNWTYAQGGNNIVSSALHWGPDPAQDAWWKTNNKRQALHTTYSAGFNTFGLEWSQRYLFTWVNSRLLQVLYTNFDHPLWDRGAFPEDTPNGTATVDAWTASGHHNAPFDQPFYLIIDLAVGGTNGWFADGQSGKPWLDQSPNAPKDFWDARAQWYPTWKQPQLEVERVLMMQQCDGGKGGEL